MGGFFGAISRNNCKYDVFFGTDYHSHLGTKRGGLITYDPEKGFARQIHNIENTPFRTKFEKDLNNFHGCSGIGCISDSDPQPLLVRSHLGTYAITTIGAIINADELLQAEFEKRHQFMGRSTGTVNETELIACLINQKDNLVDGIRHAQESIQGSVTLLILTDDGAIIAARDKLGRLPVLVGKDEAGYAVSFESFAYQKLGYEDCCELGPGEIDFITPDGVEVFVEPKEEMKICSFLWVYFGYPTSCYEGMNVEVMRYNNGRIMARNDIAEGFDTSQVDYVGGVPDSGTPHAIGYSNETHRPFARAFIKYTPTWARSFMPQTQDERNKIAKMKQIPVIELIKGKNLLFVDDSIVRGTQLHETVQFLYESGAKEVHMRSACPPIMYSCKYLNFSRSASELELIARRVIQEREGKVDYDQLRRYADPNSGEYREMTNAIGQELKFTSLEYHRLDDMIKAVGIEPCKLCTYCWSGKE